MSIQQLTNADLLFVLKQKKLKAVQERFVEKIKLADIEMMALSSYGPVKSSSNKISEALLDIANPMQYLVLLLDAIFTLAPIVTATAFAVIGVGFVALTAIAGLVTFFGVYNSMKEKDRKNDDKFLLLALQEVCADEYLKRMGQPPVVAKKPNPYKADKFKWTNAKEGLLAMFLMASTLFYTYYGVALGVAALVSASAIAGAMMGPIGLGIAVGISFAIGIAFGYKKYKHEQCVRQLKKDRQKLETQVAAKMARCDEIAPQLTSGQLPPAPPSPQEQRSQQTPQPSQGGFFAPSSTMPFLETHRVCPETIPTMSP